MKLTIEIEMDNAAFDERPIDEALRMINFALPGYVMLEPMPLYDANGNRCGIARVEGAEDE